MKSFYFALIVLALLGACDREGPAERALALGGADQRDAAGREQRLKVVTGQVRASLTLDARA